MLLLLNGRWLTSRVKLRTSSSSHCRMMKEWGRHGNASCGGHGGCLMVDS
jgi:hypothetical protein